MCRWWLLALWVPALAGATAPSEDPAPEEPAAAEAETPARAADDGKSWLVVPGVFYGQETGVGAALFGSITRPMPGSGEGTWPSTVSLAVVGTWKKQVSITLWPTLYLGTGNAWVVEGEVFAEHFPTRFYGVGPHAHSTWQTFTRDQVQATAHVRRRVAPDLYVGLSEHLAFTGVRDPSAELESEGVEASPTGDALLGHGVAGEHGSRVHATGATFRWDRRDNAESTRRGTLVEVGASAAPRFLGSTHGFGRMSLDARGFVPFGNDGTFAAQWWTDVAFGDVPFTAMPTLGGDDVLRGLYEGRFRDHGATALQAEVRYPLFWRFRAVAFAGTGQVFRTPADLVSTAPTWSAGGGLRLEIDRTNHTAIRLDIGGGPDGFGFIFTYGEAL